MERGNRRKRREREETCGERKHRVVLSSAVNERERRLCEVGFELLEGESLGGSGADSDNSLPCIWLNCLWRVDHSRYDGTGRRVRVLDAAGGI